MLEPIFALHRIRRRLARQPATLRAFVAAGLLAALCTAGCAEGPRFVERRLYAMGTWVDIAVIAPARAAEAAIDEAESLLRHFETDYYAWAPDGELAELNAALADGGEVEVDTQMAALLAEAQRLTQASGGAFDPGIGALVELWGFHAANEARLEPPARAEIDALVDAAASLSAVRIDGRRVTSDAPVKLDLGGIAKGEAVDRLVELLRRHGIHDAMVNAGGDLRVLGTRGGRPWRIGIQDPRSDGVLGVIELEDGEAAFTSGDYERYFDADGRRLHHIIDPRTGYPAEDTRAVTVVADRGAHADAAATALFVAGGSWPGTAERVGVDAVLRVDAAGRVELTRAMQRRIPTAGEEGWHVVAAH